MFIGHLPAGYILTKKLQKKADTPKYLWVGLLASVLPDIDILYFYLVDGRQHNHHSYWIHLPFYWLIIALCTFLALYILNKNEYRVMALIFFANIFCHLFLDTVVGHISWLYSITERTFYFFEVPAVYDFWVFNFVLHWTFLFEVVVIIWALYLFVLSRKEALALEEVLDKMD